MAAKPGGAPTVKVDVKPPTIVPKEERVASVGVATAAAAPSAASASGSGAAGYGDAFFNAAVDFGDAVETTLDQLRESKAKFDFVVHVVNSKEMWAAAKVLKIRSRFSFGESLFTAYTASLIARPAIDVLLVKQPRAGSASTGCSQQLVSQLLDAGIACRAVVGVGVAMGWDSQRQNMYDVMVSRVILPYSHIRGADDKNENREESLLVSNQLSNVIADDTSEHAPWIGPELVVANARVRPRLHFGAIVSGDMLIAGSWQIAGLKDLLKIDGNGYVDGKKDTQVIGGEMEGTGMFVACKTYAVPCVIIKAVTDFGLNKNAQYGTQKDIEQRRGAFAAFTYFETLAQRLVNAKNFHIMKPVLKETPANGNYNGMFDQLYKVHKEQEHQMQLFRTAIDAHLLVQQNQLKAANQTAANLADPKHNFKELQDAEATAKAAYDKAAADRKAKEDKLTVLPDTKLKDDLDAATDAMINVWKDKGNSPWYCTRIYMELASNQCVGAKFVPGTGNETYSKAIVEKNLSTIDFLRVKAAAQAALEARRTFSISFSPVLSERAMLAWNGNDQTPANGGTGAGSGEGSSASASGSGSVGAKRGRATTTKDTSNKKQRKKK